jgi:hypothetical protein
MGSGDAGAALSIVKAAEKMPSIEGNGTIIRPEAGRGTDAAGGKS